MSEAHDIGTIIEALEQYTRGDEHQRAIEAAIDVLKTATARESALVAERDALRAVALKYASWLGLTDADQALAKDLANPRMTGALAAPAVEG